MDTNISQLQTVATTLLHCELNVDDTFPFIAHHPIFGNTVYAVQNNGSVSLLNLANGDELEKAKQDMQRRIKQTKNALDFFSIINKPYLPAFFKFANRHMSQKDFSEFLAEMWTMVEFPNCDHNITVLQFVQLFRKAKLEYMMSDEELTVYNSFPETITIYRGISQNGKVRALSWSTDVNIAEWFSRRWSEDGVVMVAEIDKKDILAYFSGRGESEVVVDFKKLKNIREY